MTPANLPNRMETDVAILGAGLVGMAAAIAMHEIGLSTVLIDSAPIPAFDSTSSETKRKATSATSWDSRVYAISPKNVQWLTQIGVWQYVDEARTTHVSSMQLMADDVAQPLLLSAREANKNTLATMIESRNLSHAMLQRMQALNIATQYESRCQNLTVFDRHITIALESALKQTAKTKSPSTRTIQSQLLLAADGAQSWTRAHLNMEVQTKPYAHTAIVANFKVEHPHQNVASQWFSHDDAGENCILAWLPLASQNGAHYVSIVWSVSNAHAEMLSSLTDDVFTAKVREAGDNLLGAMTLVTARAGFPLMLQSTATIDQHVVLIGDAAHVIHPMAGQGVNLGFRDLIDLSQTLQQKHALQTLYDPQLLKQYARSRKTDVRNMHILTDGLFKLFANQNVLTQKVRQWGFRATKLKHIKQILLKVALAQ